MTRIFEDERSNDPDITSAAQASVPGIESTDLSGSEVTRLCGVTLRTLRFYETRGLIAPRRNGRARRYGPVELDRISRILRAKRLGFTLAEIAQMIEVKDGDASSPGLRLTPQKCLQQISHLEGQLKNIIEALADLRQIHLALCREAAASAEDPGK